MPGFPDHIGTVLGWRRYAVPRPHINAPLGPQGAPKHLEGFYHQQVWTPGDEPTRAECRTLSTIDKRCKLDDVPTASHSCGLYAHFSPAYCLNYLQVGPANGWVISAVAGWGRVFFDEHYWRAEYAKPLVIVDPRETFEVRVAKQRDLQITVTPEDVLEWARDTAERYGCPVLSLANAQEYADGYGSRIEGLVDLPNGPKVLGID